MKVGRQTLLSANALTAFGPEGGKKRDSHQRPLGPSI